MATFAERLQQALTLRDVKPIELSRMTKISQPLISQYLAGDCVPKQTNTFIIARALNVSEAYLIGRDVEPQRKGELTGLTESQQALFEKLMQLTPEELEGFAALAASALRLKEK